MVVTQQPFVEAVDAIRKLLGILGETGKTSSLKQDPFHWAMKAFVRLTLGASTEKDLDYDSLGLTNALYREGMFEVLATLRRLPKELREASGYLPVLFALHFRSPILEDGRATFAGTLTSKLEERLGRFLDEKDLVACLAAGEQGLTSNFQDILLQMYRKLYTRPFSFNDRVFQSIANRIERQGSAQPLSMWTVLFDFAGPEGSPLLEKVRRAGDGVSCTESRVRLGADVVRRLNGVNGDNKEDLRGRVLREIAATVEKNQNADARLLPLHPSRELRDRLAGAVEMVWHEILSEKDSVKIWSELLQELEFVDEAETFASGWSSSPSARAALFDVLRFLQGVSLYEVLAPGGLSTTVVPGLRGNIHEIGAWTIGFPAAAEGVCRTQDQLLPSATELLEGIFSWAKAKEGEVAESPLTLAQYLGNEELARDLLPQSEDEDKDKVHEPALFEVLKLALRLCHEKHEGMDLHFRFIIGRSVDLARFNEVYMFRKDGKFDEQTEFKNWDEDKRARCLKAHYSHLQDPRIGLFFDWERNAYFRFVEIVEGQRSTFAQGATSLRDENPERSRASLAKKLTSEARDLIVADTGGGRVQVYKGGKLALAWPQDGTTSWWSPKRAKSWNSEEELKSLLDKTNRDLKGKLNREQIALVADVLLWVSEASGLGCALVLTGENSDLKKYQVLLNLKKLWWVDEVSLEECGPRDMRNLLVQDGATILNLESRRLTNQIQLVAFKDGSALQPRSENEERWTYGTRHASACDFTEVVQGCTVITVSADGPISVFRDGKKLKPEPPH